MSDTLSNHSRNMAITLTDGQQPNKNRVPAQQKVELTPEELVAWQTCMTGSRSIVPPILGAALGYGLCRMSPYPGYAKYAALVSSVIGMMMGRVALANMCLTKVASMPNSNLQERLVEAGYYGSRTPFREKGLYYQGPQSLDVQSEVQSTAEPFTGIVFDDYPSMNKYDSINDNSDFNVSEDTDLTEPISLQKGVSYDELRHKNRDEFYKKTTQWVAPRASRTPPVAKETAEQVPTSSNPSPMQAKTKYGDLWD